MATFSSVSRQHVLQAIAEHDDRGADAFLGVYGFEATPGETFSHEGRTYDARAVLAVAHRYATGRAATPEELRSAPTGTLLTRRGFEVAGPVAAPRTTSATRSATRSSAGASPRRAAKPATTPRRPAPEDRPLAICPTCFTALPATGVCDTCG